MDATAFALDASRLFDTAPCALVVAQEDGLILLANAAFCQWTGFDACDLVGQRRWHELLTMGGRIFHQTHVAPLLRMQGTVSEVKFDMVRSDATVVPLLMNAVRREGSHGVHHELAFFVTKDRSRYEQALLEARRRAEDSLQAHRLSQQQRILAEARLRLALSSGALFVWDFNPQTDERHYEDGAARLLGYDAPRPVRAQEMLAAMSAHDRAIEAQALHDACAERRDALQFVVRLDGIDGVQRVVSVSAIAIENSDNPSRLYVGVLQDITEHSRERALALDRAQFAEQMVGIVSHDLRNPLSTIKMAADLLARNASSPRQDKLLGHIGEATERAKRLIAELLDFTLIRVGQGLSVTRQAIEWHGLVAQGLSELQLAFPGTVLTHHTVGTGTCRADPDRILQMLGNLIANAVTYGAAQTPVVIRTHIDDTSFMLSVQNQGVAIPASLLATMFEPMARGVATDDGSRSVGLGLFIVRAIAQAHAGTVKVSSSDEDGTTFTASFPR